MCGNPRREALQKYNSSKGGCVMQYEIKGGEMPVVEVYCDPGETIRCQGGGMLWMSDNMKMDTQGGGLGKMFGRVLSGEGLFQNTYTAVGTPGMIAFGGSFPGSIMAVEIGPGKDFICQKSAYLASTAGVELSVAFQRKVGTALFGGEGFIMQKVSGSGTVFLEIDGSAIEYELAAGQKLIIDTGHLALMESTCTMDIETVKGGAKNMLLGGEGFFNTVVTGPGKVTVQTMPKMALANAISSMLPSK